MNKTKSRKLYKAAIYSLVIMCIILILLSFPEQVTFLNIHPWYNLDLSKENFEQHEATVFELPNFPSLLILDPKRNHVRPLKFRIYSHNVHESLHSEQTPGERPWEERVHMLSNSITFNSKLNTIVALQELNKYQLFDIKKRMNMYDGEDVWSSYEIPNIDGKHLGLTLPILFKKSEWEIMYAYTHWLNGEGSKLPGWDSSTINTVTIVTLRHRITKNFINIFNTQLDPSGKKLQIMAVTTIITIARVLNRNWPTFITGELNFEPSMLPYKILHDEFKDIAPLCQELTTFGFLKSTMTGFKGEYTGEGNGKTLDYIFALKFIQSFDSTFECEKTDAYILRHHGFGLLPSKFSNEYFSDHRPLVGDFIIEKC